MPDGAIKRIPLRYRTPTDLLTMQKRQGVSVVRTGTPSVYEKFCFFPKIIGLFYKNPRDVHCTKDVSYDGCNLKVTILKHSHFLS